MTEKTIKYTIDVPEPAIPELEDLMKRHGAHFSPTRQVTAINDAFMDQALAMGHHLPDLVRGMNEFLGEAGAKPLVPTDWGSWEPARIQECLKLAVREFQWDGSTVLDAWFIVDGQPWSQVVEKHPEVFQEKD